MRNVKGNPLYNTQLVLKNQGRIARGSFFAKIQNPQVEAGAWQCSSLSSNLRQEHTWHTPWAAKHANWSHKRPEVLPCFTGTFLLVCLQPVAGLPKVWSRQREPRASAHILNAEATSPHLAHIWICNIWMGSFASNLWNFKRCTLRDKVSTKSFDIVNSVLATSPETSNERARVLAAALNQRKDSGFQFFLSGVSTADFSATTFPRP